MTDEEQAERIRNIRKSMDRINELMRDLKHMPEAYAHEIERIETISERYKSAGLVLIEGGKDE